MCSPHRKVQQASIKQLVAEMQPIVSSGPRSGGTPAEPGCAEACASGQMEYKPQTKVVQATAAGPAGSSPRQGRGDGRGREGPEGAGGRKELGQARAALLEATFYWSGEDRPLENWEPQRPCHGLNPGPQKVGPHPDPQCP